MPKDGGGATDSGTTLADTSIQSTDTSTAALRGVVTRASDGAPVSGARVVLYDPVYLDEARTGSDGTYAFETVPGGALSLGVAARGYAYDELLVEGDAVHDFVLTPETEPGRWTTIGDTAPEYFAGTPSGTILPDGRAMYCHDTEDAVAVDPVDGSKTFPSDSQLSQGCHMQTVLSDGRVLFVGGQDPEDPASFVNGVPYVKTWDPVADTWTRLADLNEPRWYPTLVHLPDDRVLACGGGQPPDATRTPTCEVFDPDSATWDVAPDMLNPTEYAPTVLLLDGEVLATWSPPQLWDPDTRGWRETGGFVDPDRGYPDHADHTLLLLSDGTAVAVGNRNGGAVVERYDPATGTWTARASPDVRRYQAEVLQLPDGRVFAGGGFWAGGVDVPRDHDWPAVATTDLYDPDGDTWRNVADMLLPREYHALTLLAPDGRVLVTSGTSDQARGDTWNNQVDAFEPPYLFRGPRPVVDSVSSTEPPRGGTLTVTFSRTRAPTSVVLLGANAVTHWVDGGVTRRLLLTFRHTGEATLEVQLPSDAVLLPAGLYVLYLMVDDVPSEGVVVSANRSDVR